MWLCRLLVLGALGGCSPETPRAAPTETQPAPQRSGRFAESGPIDDLGLGGFWVSFSCSINGLPLAEELQFKLLPEAAPNALRRFLQLADSGAYDGLPIHRVEREFVLQGGRVDGVDSLSDVTPEPSLRPDHQHHYGVLSMASPARREFIICLAESPKVWALDDQGLSVLGRLVHGGATLEELANSETAHISDGESSMPVDSLVIDRVSIHEGDPPSLGWPRRPQPDLRGEPERVTVRHIRISFRGRARSPEAGIRRSREEARALASEVLAAIESGQVSFTEAAQRWSDDPLLPDSHAPAVRHISNYGVLDIPAQSARQRAPRLLNEYITKLGRELKAGDLSQSEVIALQEAKIIEIARWVQEIALDRREDVNAPAFADACFLLAPGEVTKVDFDRFTCPGGWYIIERVE